MRRFFLLVAAVLLSGCAASPFTPAQLQPTRGTGPAALLEEVWLNQPGVYRMRQSGVFRFGWEEIPLEGYMQLNTGAQRVRLLGLDPMGVKLFDLEIDPEQVRTHHLIAELEKYPRFTEAVAASARRIFFRPLPELSDRFTAGELSYLFEREGALDCRFLFGGAGERMLEKECRGAEESWKVAYYDYSPVGTYPVPAGILLDDDRAGYRLTLWLEEIKRVDE